ncbi:MAG: aspartate 1-decarboxylase [Phycisphaerae bacterium]|nr:aspartate 1-decarboxylase [Phycisphaerae bacterium]
MLIKVLKSKLHNATVTATKLHYSGSLGIGSELMQAAGIEPYEAIIIADIDNGSRLETYAIPAEQDGGIEVLGAAAKLIEKGHRVIIMSFAMLTLDEAKEFNPKTVVLRENNEIEKII